MVVAGGEQSEVQRERECCMAPSPFPLLLAAPSPVWHRWITPIPFRHIQQGRLHVGESATGSGGQIEDGGDGGDDDANGDDDDLEMLLALQEACGGDDAPGHKPFTGDNAAGGRRDGNAPKLNSDGAVVAEQRLSQPSSAGEFMYSFSESNHSNDAGRVGHSTRGSIQAGYRREGARPADRAFTNASGKRQQPARGEASLAPASSSGSQLFKGFKVRNHFQQIFRCKERVTQKVDTVIADSSVPCACGR